MWETSRPCFKPHRGWSGGAIVLGKLPVPGRPTVWMIVGQGPIALAADAGVLDIFTLLYLFSPLSPSRWETARYKLNPKQPTNQPTSNLITGKHSAALILFTANSLFQELVGIKGRKKVLSTVIQIIYTVDGISAESWFQNLESRFSVKILRKIHY